MSIHGGSGTAVVTGASGGIGLEIARELALRGYPLVLAARSQARMEGVAQELSKAHGVRVQALVADLSRPEGARDLWAAISERGIEPEILVNNAGVGLHGPYATADESALLGLLQLNVTSLALLARLALPGMVARRRGRLLNVASTAAFVPGPFMAAYYASKAFVLSLSVALNEELRGTGVTATALCPGATQSSFAEVAGMSRSRLFRSGVMGPGPVARAGVAGLLAGRSVVVPGFRNKALTWSSAIGPRWLTAKVTRSLQDPRDMA